MYEEFRDFDLPFTSIDNDELCNLFIHDHDCSHLPHDISFNLFESLEDKYNSNLDANFSCIFSKYHNIPKSDYIFLHSLYSHSLHADITTIISMNIRSIPTNFQSLVDLILMNPGIKCDILGLTETRLSNDIVNLYQLPGYNLFTQCRNRYGGGVAIYISDNYNSTMVNDFCFVEPYMECLAVQCVDKHRKHLFICVYRPPNGNVNNFFDRLNDVLSSAYNMKYFSINICGDFNLDLLKFDDSSVFHFINLMFSFSLFPLITRPTRITNTTATLIDHIWTSNVDSNINNFIIKTDLSDHYPVVSQFNEVLSKQNHPVYNNKRILSQTALNKFVNDIRKVNWSDVLELNCPDSAYNVFFDKFNNMFQNNFPVRRVVMNNKQERSPYITSALRNSIKEKHRLERLAHKWPLTFKEIYKRYRNKLTSILRVAKENHYKNQLKSNQGDPKSHWKCINSILGKTSSLPFKPKIELEPNCLNIPNKFNEHFLKFNENQSNINDKNHLKYLTNPPMFSMYLIPVSISETESYLQSLKTNTPGYDDISPKILKHAASQLSIPVSHIINLSLKTGNFPDKLKIAKVIPIHKSGTRTDVNNYRPISILPAFSKIFEKVIAKRLIEYLEKNKFLSPYQHGFRANHSTETAITQFTEYIYKHLEEKHHVVGIFIDLSKAFDSLNHNILLDKLEHIGIRGVPLKLFQNYLHNRTQSVYCNGLNSSSNSIKTGVPQGSILGPLLFLVYINDITNASSKFRYTIYADDTSLILADRDMLSLHRSLTNELELVNEWIKINKLKLNISKTNYTLFQNRSLHYQLPPLLLEGNTVNCVTHTKFLGVHIDCNLNWNYQINDVFFKLSRMNGILYKIRNHLTVEALLSIYYTLCYPHLTYCVSLWACTWPSFITKLKAAQNKIFRCIFNLGKFESTVNMLSDHKLLNFYSIHKCFLLLFIYKNIANVQENPVFRLSDSGYSTRQNHVNLVCPRYRTTLFKHSIFYYGPQLWNALPNEIRNVSSHTQFKRKIKDYMYNLQNSQTHV